MKNIKNWWMEKMMMKVIIKINIQIYHMMMWAILLEEEIWLEYIRMQKGVVNILEAVVPTISPPVVLIPKRPRQRYITNHLYTNNTQFQQNMFKYTMLLKCSQNNTFLPRQLILTSLMHIQVQLPVLKLLTT